MGAGASLNIAADKENKEKKDARRRNSLAFNIMTFVQYEEDDFTPVIDKIRQNLIEQGPKKEKVTKSTKKKESTKETKEDVIDTPAKDAVPKKIPKPRVSKSQLYNSASCMLHVTGLVNVHAKNSEPTPN